MKRTYELVFIADPRLADEEVVALSEEYKEMLKERGGTITREESWGRRKLAYPIKKFTEGKYVILYLDAEPGHRLSEVEQRMEQNDKVLRYLLVRTDLDLKRAASKAKKKPVKAGEGSATAAPTAAR